MKRRKRKLVVRILQRILAQGRGEVRALEQAIQLEVVLRFVGLLALLVLLPALLLAWYGLSSMADQGLGLQQEVGLEATTASDRGVQNIERYFSVLEGRVLNRLHRIQ